MPQKGLFTQGAVVLFEREPALDELEEALTHFTIAVRNPAHEHWELSGPSLLVPFRPEHRGAVAIDIVSRVWPDHMGDPKGDSMLFAAWSMGHFGPGAFPGGLERAMQNSWHWDAGPAQVDRHKAFVRIRTSYVFGAKNDDPVFPPDYDPREELLFNTSIARAILTAPGALCYFNPNGEMLHRLDSIEECLDEYEPGATLPQRLWCNVRLIRLTDHEPWMLMDTVGMAQLDVVDHEALFPDEYEPSEVAGFLRNIADYILQRGPVIKNGDTASGPGGVDWQAFSRDEPIYKPPRPVLRWVPLDGSKVPPALTHPPGTVH